MDGCKEVVLTGPKGVGKSFTLLAVMAIRSGENKPTVLLSVDSLTDIEQTTTYLNNIMTEYWAQRGEFIFKLIGQNFSMYKHVTGFQSSK